MSLSVLVDVHGLEVVAVTKSRLLLQSEQNSFLLTQYYGH